ncbi:MAG: DNA repair protein rad2 [Stictis urceolatum]|nr:DNA repair protein rad2 [Stictis urceolata]
MGVTGLWTVLQPCARPIKLETLNKKRLAVDASIWIYQFLKAVRDKEGNALRNSHVVGFFRRICKLLFFGIKPVFVFDGGAPALKRQTISARKSRREGRREDAVRTAGKLLAVQMQRRAEEDERKRREEAQRPRRQIEDEEEELPENLVYVEELNMTEQERRKNRTFKKKDAYHLPGLDVSLAEMGAPNDPRIMSQEELEEYARQFHSGEDINLYDFSKIDFNSPFFQSLPPSDRYNILNAARLRSRLRMGYSKEQLDTMFPDRMAFSRFQIERVTERNELTQRLMNLNGMNGEDFSGPGRIAGEKGKEYVLVKNEGVEGGWALGVVSGKNEGEREQPIDVETLDVQPKEDDSDWEDVDGFIDVPIEGLNRLPKPPPARPTAIEALTSDRATSARRAVYQSKRNDVNGSAAVPVEHEEDPDSLFLPPEPEEDDEDNDELFEDVLPPTDDDEEAAELQRAIAMSLEQPEEEEPGPEEDAANRAAMMNGPPVDKPLDFNKKNAKAGRAFAQVTNNRAQADMASNTAAPAVPGSSLSLADPSTSKKPTFSGPLPFESINLGKSFLRPKKKKLDEEGGFERDDEKKKSRPLPPWFTGDVREGNAAQKAMDDKVTDEQELNEDDEEPEKAGSFEPVLRRHDTVDIIDIDQPVSPQKEPIEVVSSEEGSDIEMGDIVPVQRPSKSVTPTPAVDSVSSPELVAQIAAHTEPTMNDMADRVRAEPPSQGLPDKIDATTEQGMVEPMADAVDEQHIEPAAEEVDWSESDYEDTDKAQRIEAFEPVGGEICPSSAKSSSPEFEDVDMAPPAAEIESTSPTPKEPEPPSLPKEDTFDQIQVDVDMVEDEYSDPEDEDLMRQLAAEAEEHARFASAINSSTQLQSAEDYERELKQLRNQQKKDRRDADEVTQIMIQECQQLLQLFGLPYITAPMEAEAQCAELVSLGLVDGIVTDDSDTFLFGGTRVYKNMFNQAKFVECYLSSDLEKEYSLTREKIIQIAHLLGSDYTEGLPSVGPVTALEILSEFQHLDAFKEWWTGVQTGTIPASDDAKVPFRKKFRKNATKLFLPPIFPDMRVDEAYLHPDVDSDPSQFQWGVPDLDRLRAFLMATIGWSQERADEILVPVIRDMNKREQEGTQSNITQFFGGSVGTGSARQRGAAAPGEVSAEVRAVGGEQAFAPRRRGEEKSKRMENALGRLHKRAQRSTRGEKESGSEVEEQQEERSAAKRIAQPRKRAKATQQEEDVSEDGMDDEAYEPPKKAAKRGKRNAK